MLSRTAILTARQSTPLLVGTAGRPILVASSARLSGRRYNSSGRGSSSDDFGTGLVLGFSVSVVASFFMWLDLGGKLDGLSRDVSRHFQYAERDRKLKFEMAQSQVDHKFNMAEIHLNHKLWMLRYDLPFEQIKSDLLDLTLKASSNKSETVAEIRENRSRASNELKDVKYELAQQMRNANTKVLEQITDRKVQQVQATPARMEVKKVA